MSAFETVLHPTDFSERSQAALHVARAIARDQGARLVLLHVAPREVVGVEGVAIPFDARYYEEELQRMRAKLEGPDLKRPIETVVCQGEAGDEILRCADHCGAALIVMGTHGRTGLKRMLMGSVAESVVRRARCPVLTLRSALTPHAQPHKAAEGTVSSQA